MLQPSVIILQNMTADLSLYEKSVSAAKVILTGFIVVFGMLLLLIGIIKLYSAIVAGAQKAADKHAKRKERVKEPVSADNGVHIIQKPAYITGPAADDDIPDKIDIQPGNLFPAHIGKCSSNPLRFWFDMQLEQQLISGFSSQHRHGWLLHVHQKTNFPKRWILLKKLLTPVIQNLHMALRGTCIR